MKLIIPILTVSVVIYSLNSLPLKNLQNLRKQKLSAKEQLKPYLIMFIILAIFIGLLFVYIYKYTV